MQLASTWHRGSARRFPRVHGARLSAALAVALAAALGVPALGISSRPAIAAGLLSSEQVPEPGVPVDASLLLAAQALGEANSALAQGDAKLAAAALARAKREAEALQDILPDYVGLFEARTLLARGKAQEAADAAERGGEKHRDSPIAVAFQSLRGDCLLAIGDEMGARAAWTMAMQRPEATPEGKQALHGAILSSHERTGTLQAAIARGELDSMQVGADPQLPEPLRFPSSPAVNLARGDDLAARGRRAAAIEAYQAALAGNSGPEPSPPLSQEQRHHAQLEIGHAQFSLRHYPEAVASFAALLPAPEPRFWHARAVARSGEYATAIRLFEAIGAIEDPKYGSFALYLAATLLEDRDEHPRAMKLYHSVALREGATDRGRDALWRLGWAAYRRDDFENARLFLTDLAGRAEGLDRLRPAYWMARTMEQDGDPALAQREFARLARDYPLSYYGWRASERLSAVPADANPKAARQAPVDKLLDRGSSQIEALETLRVAVLLAADLPELAERELGSFAANARGIEDRKTVASLYARAGAYYPAQRLVVDAYAESLSEGLQQGDEALWWLSWPPAYKSLVLAEFPDEAIIEPALVWAIMREESSYRPTITSSAGARGLLQIMPETGAQLAEKRGLEDFEADDLFSPRINIKLGSAYLDELGRRFPGRISAAIGSYNAGPTAVDSWLRGAQANREDDVWVEDIPYAQTRSYVKRVLRSLQVYRAFYDVKAPGA